MPLIMRYWQVFFTSARSCVPTSPLGYFFVAALSLVSSAPFSDEPNAPHFVEVKASLMLCASRTESELKVGLHAGPDEACGLPLESASC